MKKLLVFAALAALTLAPMSSEAQKQIGGDKIIEANFTPFSAGQPVININGLKFRMFTSENVAIRLNFHLGTMKEVTVNTQPGAADIVAGAPESALNSELNTIDKTFDFGIQPGIEIHTEGTDRLSPYIGGVLDIALGSESTEEEFWGPLSVADHNNQAYSNFGVFSRTAKDGYFRFGIFGVLGVDYYFADNIYLGAELGIGFSNTSYRDTEFSYSNDAAYGIKVATDGTLGTTIDEDNLPDNEDPVINGKENHFGPVANAALRLGWIIAQ
ncbi:MAG: hypothetical protein KDC12_02825 [Flavobacteriales bacterium]|nr:hypothetical protein [Flavobacteriales bacterium]